MSDRITVRVAPDGVPVTLVDVAGDALDGTLWGATRVGGLVALVVTEDDHLSGDRTGPPTPGQMRALADALDGDTDADQWPLEGSRRWEKARADKLAADVATMQQSVRDYAEEAQRWKGHNLAIRTRLTAEQQAAEAREGLRRVQLKLGRTVIRRQQRQLDALRAHRRRNTVTAALLGAAAGLLIGRNR